MLDSSNLAGFLIRVKSIKGIYEEQDREDVSDHVVMVVNVWGLSIIVDLLVVV